MDTLNRFGVSVSGAGRVVILFPPQHGLSREDAYMLAAWLMAMAETLDPPEELEQPRDVELERSVELPPAFLAAVSALRGL